MYTKYYIAGYLCGRLYSEDYWFFKYGLYGQPCHIAYYIAMWKKKEWGKEKKTYVDGGGNNNYRAKKSQTEEQWLMTPYWLACAVNTIKNKQAKTD